MEILWVLHQSKCSCDGLLHSMDPLSKVPVTLMYVSWCSKKCRQWQKQTEQPTLVPLWEQRFPARLTFTSDDLRLKSSAEEEMRFDNLFFDVNLRRQCLRTQFEVKCWWYKWMVLALQGKKVFLSAFLRRMNSKKFSELLFDSKMLNCWPQ